MKKVIMTVSIVAAMVAFASCSCCNNKDKEAACCEKTECCDAEKCAGCDKKDGCENACCEQACCDSTSTCDTTVAE